MRKVCDFIAQSPLFEGLDHDTYGTFCEKCTIHLYWKGELIAREGDICPGIGVVFEGQVAKQKYAPNGDSSTLDLLGPGDTFGEELIFSRYRRHTTSLEAVSSVKIIYIKRDELLEMMSRSPLLLNNLLALLSDQLHLQNQRIYVLSQRTLRQKISSYLIELLREQLNEDGQTLEEASRIISTQSVELPSSKEVVARLLSMPRPSFSRELISMEKDGLIRASGRVIWLLDLKKLSSGLIDDYVKRK